MSPARPRPLAALIGLAAALLFAGSLFLPVATAHQTQGLTVIGGFEMLYMGAFGPLTGQFGWFATPCLLYALIVLLRRRTIGNRQAIILALVMALLLADALSWRNYPNDGGDGPIVAFGLGYYAWIAAVVLGIIGVLLARAVEYARPIGVR